MTELFDEYCNTIVEGYFEVEPDFQRKLSLAVSGKKIKLKRWGILTEIDAGQLDAQDILKKLKEQKVIVFYRYPIVDPEKILAFKSLQDVKNLLRSDPNALQGYAHYK